LVSPADFIPLAEETGLIVPLGSWVLKEACREVAGWQQSRPGTDPLSLSVNVSARQLADADLSKTVHSALEDSGLRPATLSLEITESAVMRDPEASAKVLRELKLLGVGVCVDDFGTGYSSMASLKKLPVDVLKIDRTFVSGVDGGPEDRAIVAAVVHLAEALELDIVAEGVERPTQAIELRRLGCGYAQGFDWSRPLPTPSRPTRRRAVCQSGATECWWPTTSPSTLRWSAVSWSAPAPSRLSRRRPTAGRPSR
jgi:EAL domain-containing protein (putative c-di-GMP-specific phosphodiesterase class I)